MNRINPLHIGVLLAVVLIFLSYKLIGAKEELKEVKTEYSNVSELAVSLSALKDVYSDKKKAKASLRRLLAHSSLRSANITQNSKKSSVILNCQSMDKQALNTLMGKVLNASYNITGMKIKKLSSDKVSFKMEIKW